MQELAQSWAESKRKSNQGMATHLLEITLPAMEAQVEAVAREAQEAERQAQLEAQLEALRAEAKLHMLALLAGEQLSRWPGSRPQA